MYGLPFPNMFLMSTSTSESYLGLQVYFTLDSGVREAVLYHKLRFYEDGEMVR